MPEEKNERERPYSEFRDFLIPDVRNTLQSAAYRHELGDYDGAKELLNSARGKIDLCDRQLEEDRRVWQQEEEEDDDAY